ncbi:MAG: type II toxin-antitoxin system VapC family toxin [Rhizobiaceae bacterium]
MTKFVVDASVALKWYLTEQDTDKALQLINDKFTLLAPNLLRIELGNAIWKNVRLGNTTIAVWDGVSSSLTASVDMIETNTKMLDRAFEIAVESDHPLYDCVYLALAIEADAKVATVDKRFLTTFAKTKHSERILSLDQAIL